MKMKLTNDFLTNTIKSEISNLNKYVSSVEIFSFRPLSTTTYQINTTITINGFELFSSRHIKLSDDFLKTINDDILYIIQSYNEITNKNVFLPQFFIEQLMTKEFILNNCKEPFLVDNDHEKIIHLISNHDISLNAFIDVLNFTPHNLTIYG